MSNKNRNHPEPEIPEMKQYYLRDDRLVIFFGPINRYCNGFSVYYQGHFRYSHELGANPDGYSIIVT